MTSERMVPVQEAAHMIDENDLVMCSDIIHFATLNKARELRYDGQPETDDVVTLYRKRSPQHENMSLQTYFYQIYCRDKNKTRVKNGLIEETRILLPKGLHCRPTYPVDYDYARGMLIMHKPWSTRNTLEKLLKNKQATIQEFSDMITRKELPTSVVSEYHRAVAHSQKKRIELVAKEDSTDYPPNLDDMDADEIDEWTAWMHANRLTDDTPVDGAIGGLVVDIGEKYDWTQLTFPGTRETTIDGKEWIKYARKKFYDSPSSSGTTNKTQVHIPKRKDGSKYKLEQLSEEQQAVVLAVVDTVVKFLTNDSNYRPLRATVTGCGGSGKSYIINTIMTIIRELTLSNDTVKIAAPTGAAAYNVQGSTLHRLFKIDVDNPSQNVSKKNKTLLSEQLKTLLVLMIDERSMITSQVFASVEKHVRESIFNGHNSTEWWGGLPVVLLFGDDYQLFPVAAEGAIRGYSKNKKRNSDTATDKPQSKERQLDSHIGSYLFETVMTENVFNLTKNFRVKSNKSRQLYERVRKGEQTEEDLDTLMNLCFFNYEYNDSFMAELNNNPKKMWLYPKRADVRNKNVEMLVEQSKCNKVPVARLKCVFHKHKDNQESSAVRHFKHDSYIRETDLCVGARVALKPTNYLPEIGLYNGAHGTIVDFVYRDNTAGPNNKDGKHLPDYVIVDFPHLCLPDYIEPWDKNNPTVRTIKSIFF